MGDWYAPPHGRYPSLPYPAKLNSLDHPNGLCVSRYFSGGTCADLPVLLVHPLTKIGEEWWYKGGEPKASPSPRDRAIGQIARLAEHGASFDSAVAKVIDELLESAKAEPTPSPTPSHLDLLPEALSDIGLTEDQARAIWESRDDLFVVGEPVTELVATCMSDATDELHIKEGWSQPGVQDSVFITCVSGAWVTPADSVRVARRIAAIAKRGGE